MTPMLCATDLAICQRVAPIVCAMGVDYDVSMWGGAARLMYESPEALNIIMDMGGFKAKAEAWYWIEHQRRQHARLMGMAVRGIGNEALIADVERMIRKHQEEDGV